MAKVNPAARWEADLQDQLASAFAKRDAWLEANGPVEEVAVTENEDGDRLYDYTLQRENGGSQNLYWGNHSKQVTAAELQEIYNADDNARLRESFGSFDNYMAYMDERQDLINNGEYKADWWDTGTPLVGSDGLSGALEDRELEQSVMQEGARQGEIGYNAQSDIFNSLYEKYTGESTTKYLDNGARYEWNGSSFVLTQEAFGPDWGAIIGSAIPGIVLSAGLAGPLGGMLGNATGSAGLGKGIAAGVGNAAGQYVSTGSVDPRSVLSSAVIGGLNPGGTLGDNLGLVPDNVTAGFVQGATNSALGDLIATGDVDLQGALLAGGIGAGTNAIKDLFSDASQFSIEAEMERIKAERALTPELTPPLTTEQLYQEALLGTMTGRSDLGGLIGDDGLLSFIPAVKTGGLNNLLGGGYFDPNAVFTGPDGKNYTDVELLQQGIDPSDVFTGGVDGWSYSASSGFWSPVKGDGNGLLSDNGFLDALAEQEFENQYGMTPTDFLAGGGTVDELKRMIAYGPLDETYNWSDNPRGTSQYVGLLTGLVDGYSTGSLNDQRAYQAGDGGISDALNITNYQDTAASAPDPNGSVAIINLGGGETVVNPNATLPGSNITVIDAITQGIIDGILVDNSGSTASGNAGGNTTDVNVNENAVNTDDSLASNDAGTNSNENAVNTDDSLAGSGNSNSNGNENAINNNDDLASNENAISTDDDLPAGGGGGGGGGGGLFAPANGDGLPPIWTDLDPYTTIKRYKSQRTKLLDGMMASLTQQNAAAPTSFVPKSPSEKELFEAGMFS